MRTRALRSLAVACALAPFAGALASGIDDGNAGLDALQAGNYDQAIALFTRALKSGTLAGGDKEFAYLNRGKAYLGKHECARAIADARLALRLKPGDSDAQDALSDAQACNSGGAASAGGGWGMLASLAGRSFWVEPPGKSGHTTLQSYDWLTPQQVLRYTIRTKRSTVAVGLYKLDATTGILTEAEAFTSGVYYATSTATAASETQNAYINNIPVRTVSTLSGSIVAERNQKFANGAWQDLSSDSLVEATPAEIAAAGFKD